MLSDLLETERHMLIRGEWGRVPEDQPSEPIKIPLGIYMGWLFDDNKTYQCLEQ